MKQSFFDRIPTNLPGGFFVDPDQMPVAFGFPAGHAEVNYPLLMGSTVKLDVKKDSYTLEWIPAPR